MPEYNLNFFEAWDELDESEDNEINKIEDADIENINDVLDNINNNYNDLQWIINLRGKQIDQNITNGIKSIAEKVCGKFNKNKHKWIYQLQLMCNAYIIEKSIENALKNKDDTLIIELQNKLNVYNENNKIKTIFKKISNNAEDYSLSGVHDKLFVDTNEQEKNIADIELNTNDIDCAKKFEIKATAYSKSLPDGTNYHNADVVLVYVLDRYFKASIRQLYVMFKLENGKYSDLILIDNYQLSLIEKPIRIIPNTISIVDFIEK